MIMKKIITAVLLFVATVASAQTADDPTIMVVNGQAVPRSEFEYSYNKNNAEGVIDKKSIEEYVDLFINYKLKVEAAKDAHLDTLSSFKEEFASYRDQQIKPAFITDEDVEAEARKIYAETQHRIDSMGGMVKPAHILLLLGQKATQEQQDAAKVRIDSIYNAIQAGADFAELARNLSDDKNSARNGGELPWLTKGQTLPDFEKTVFAMEKGQLSAPVLTPAGWHIIKQKQVQIDQILILMIKVDSSPMILFMLIFCSSLNSVICVKVLLTANSLRWLRLKVRLLLRCWKTR